MNTRKFLLIVSISTLFIACGSHRKVRSSTGTKSSSHRKKEVQREAKKIIASTPKDEKKPVATIPYNERVQSYIYQYAGIAKLEMAKYGIPASITLAQGILESGAGQGELTSKAKNHFGIKCHDWTGERVYHDDDRSQECFRKYDQASQSFRDHSLFLKNRKRYEKLFTYKTSDYKSWALGLREAGYATDKKYPVKLINIIERYQLYKFDKEVLGTRYQVEKIVEKIPEKEPAPITTIAVVKDQYVVQKGDTLYSISKRHNVKVADLKTYNNLKDNTIAIGQILKIKPD